MGKVGIDGCVYEIPVKFTEVCGYNVTKCEKVQRLSIREATEEGLTCWPLVRHHKRTPGLLLSSSLPGLWPRPSSPSTDPVKHMCCHKMSCTSLKPKLRSLSGVF